MADQISQTLPDSVAQVAASNQLGPFSQVYRASDTKQGVFDSVALVTGAVAVVLLFLFFILNIRGSLVLAFMAATITATIILIVRNLQARDNAVYLFQSGIIYSHGEELTPLPWPQIVGCETRDEWQHGRLGRGIVKRVQGRPLPIGNLPDYEELADRIDDAVEGLAPQA